MDAMGVLLRNLPLVLQVNEEKLRCAVEQSALGKLKQVARVAPHPEHLEDHPMRDVSGWWSHDDHKSRKWGCGTPSKWPFFMVCKWLVILTTYCTWDAPPGSQHQDYNFALRQTKIAMEVCIVHGYPNFQ